MMVRNCFRETRQSANTVLSRSRTFYTNGDIKPNIPKKSYDYKNNFPYKNNFQQIKYMQQKDSQVILFIFVVT